MSHDRKPGRVRVMKGKNAKLQRGSGGGSAPAGDAVSVARARKSGRRGQAMMVVLFLLASIGSAVGIEMFLPS